MERVTNRITWEGEKVKGSRFIVNIAPVSTTEAASDFLTFVQNRYKDAGHHCFGYRLLNGIFRYSDDGEPKGSAGGPILKRLESRDIVDTIIVLTRYFGGTKLGIGGLIRAYGGAAGDALEHVSLETVREMTGLTFEYDYADERIVQSIICAYELNVVERFYREKIKIVLSVLRVEGQNIRDEIVNKSAGRIQFEQ